MGGKSGLPFVAWPGGTQGSGRKQGNPKPCEPGTFQVVPRINEYTNACICKRGFWVNAILGCGNVWKMVALEESLGRRG